jgi:ABC-type molybdenum transport system ATPase subunit/photorepair protein PhrA
MMSKQILLAERSHLLADLANVEKSMKAVASMRDSAQGRAELVLAHCADEVRELTDRLVLLDEGLAALQTQSD